MSNKRILLSRKGNKFYGKGYRRLTAHGKGVLHLTKAIQLISGQRDIPESYIDSLFVDIQWNFRTKQQER